MVTFIDELIDLLLNKGDDISHSKIILPSKRAGILFKRALVKRLKDQTLYLPEIKSIEELTDEISGLLPASQVQLHFEMYDAYLKVQHVNPDSFLDFLGWSSILLGDFNEIDRYLIPTGSFFNYLGAVKDLERWGVSDEPTDLVKNYIHFWNSLSPFYEQLNDSLKSQGIGYQGMQYREAARNINDFISQDDDFYIFAGFNALNTAEQVIIQAFLEANRATIFWDIDSFFLKEHHSTVGRFINSYKKDWPYYNNNPFLKGNDHYLKPKQIKSIAVSQRIGQAKYIGQLLGNIQEHELEQTAIILGDEALLLPVLNSLPQHVKSLNVTMGLPLNQVPDATFFESLFFMHQQINGDSFYYKNLIAFLQQGHVKLLLGKAATAIQQKIEKENHIYLHYKQVLALCGESNQAASWLFTPWNDSAKTAITAATHIITAIKNVLLPKKNWLQLEYLFAFQQLFNQLQDLSKNFNHLESTKTLYYFYKELLSQETLDFKGDPYSGLQIMGVLESRVLDFKNVIITGLNEGILPAGKTQNSFIPFDLKLEYKLPTYREKDAIYSYHFFRLLQRADSVFLLYNNEATGLNRGEKSRFLLQLETQKPSFDYQQLSVNAGVSIPPRKLKNIIKTPDIMAVLHKQAQYGFSPSALTTYIRNPLDFYHRYVLGIEEIDTIEEVVAHNTLGTVVHDALENLYSTYLNKELTVAILEKIKTAVFPEVESQFVKSYNAHNFKSGKNLIIFNVAVQFVNNILDMEIDQLKNGNSLVIKKCEQKLSIALTAKGQTITLRGTVDRVDQYNGMTRIIDYKTGKVEAKELKINDWEALLNDYKKHAKAFQVLCYALMLQKTQTLPHGSQAGIISFKNLQQGFLNFQENKDSELHSGVLAKFEDHLMQLIAEIMNIDMPFIEKEV